MSTIPSRFQQMPDPPADPIFGLKALFNQDERPHKLDLTAGVYKDEAGRTPAMDSVAAAQQHLVAAEQTKDYLPIAGDASYSESVGDLVLPGGPAGSWFHTPSGTAALALATRLVASAGATRVWLPAPTWPNHAPIVASAGLEVATYPYGTRPEGRVEAITEALAQVRREDIVLFHLCCHNPTGSDLSAAEWEQVAGFVSDRGLTVLLDAAYIGFADRPEVDRLPVAVLADAAPELYVSTSFSKNFGLYRERVGALHIGISDAAERRRAFATASSITRTIWSNPPWLGAAIVDLILRDDERRSAWTAELDAIRGRLNSTRGAIGAAFAERGLDAVAGIDDGRGMFHVADLTPEQVKVLREDHAVYMLSSGRFNVAALLPDGVAQLADAVAAL